MKVLVIIVSYNFKRWMNRCLGSLQKSEYPVTVLVIDNHSTDRTVERIQNEYPEVRVIANPKNLGFGAANNIGFQIAIKEKFDFVFLLNQDAWIDKNVIGTLIELSQKHPQYGIWSPVHWDGEGTELDHGFAAYSGLHDKQLWADSRSYIECPFINAAFWLIPVSILKKVGGFSPLFYHYGEDKDYVNRLKYHGYRLAYSPQVFGYHDRKNRTPGRDTYFRPEEVYLLSEYANINRSFISSFGYGVLAGLKKSFTSLLKLRIKDSISYNVITLKLITKTSDVYRIRRETSLTKYEYIEYD